MPCIQWTIGRWIRLCWALDAIGQTGHALISRNSWPRRGPRHWIAEDKVWRERPLEQRWHQQERIASTVQYRWSSILPLLLLLPPPPPAVAATTPLLLSLLLLPLLLLFPCCYPCCCCCCCCCFCCCCCPCCPAATATTPLLLLPRLLFPLLLMLPFPTPAAVPLLSPPLRLLLLSLLPLFLLLLPLLLLLPSNRSFRRNKSSLPQHT